MNGTFKRHMLTLLEVVVSCIISDS